MKRSRAVGFLTVLSFLLAPTPGWAHHAKEYLVTGSYETTHEGSHLVYLNHAYDFENADDSDTYNGELTPGWIYGITDALQVEFHFHVIDPSVEESEEAGKDGFIESVAPGIKYAFPERDNWPGDVAVAAEVEFATGDGKRAGSQDQVWPHLILRRVWKRGLESTLDVAGRFELSGDDHSEWGLAFATKAVVTPWLSAGAEFEIPADAQGARIIPGLYLSRGHALLKLGIALGLTSDASDVAVLSSASYQF